MTSELTEAEWIIERIKIIDVIVGIANAMDKQDWQKLRNYLADRIDVDYSDFRGELPQKITAEAYVQQRKAGLAGLKTLHISTNHELTIRKNTAQCWSAYRIYRLDPKRETEQYLNTAGNYQHQLTQVGGTWRVSAIKQTVVISDGDRQIHKGLSGS